MSNISWLSEFITKNPEFCHPVDFIKNNAIGKLSEEAYLTRVLTEDDAYVQLIADLKALIEPSDLKPTTTANSCQCDAWSFYGFLLLLRGRIFQAIAVFDSLYESLAASQSESTGRLHKGLPLFRISQCYRSLGFRVLSKRYMMLTLCEDAITDNGTLNLNQTGSYSSLALEYGLTDQMIREYASRAYDIYNSDSQSAKMPEWILPKLDKRWSTEVASTQELGHYHISREYCRLLLNRADLQKTGERLEYIADYLVSSMPGCRTHVRKRSPSTDYDIIGTLEGPITDFRSEFGRYFVCECKDKSSNKADFTEIAKFCRVLDSIKAKLGIIFCPNGNTGSNGDRDSDREILKVYQDRGIVIVVIDKNDIKRVLAGENFIAILREKYERVRLDLQDIDSKATVKSP